MPRVRKGDVVWVEPRLVAEIEFGEWTRDGRLRHPRYQSACATTSRRARCGASGPAEDVVRKGKRELRLSNLDKVFWPDEGITKGDLLDYYRAGRAGARPAPAQPAVHDAALPRRDRRQGVLPEGRAVAHAGVDPDVPRARLDARAAQAKRGSSSRS